MQVFKDVEVIVEEKTSKIRALFDVGSSFTVMGYATFKGIFGEISAKSLPKPKEAALANGQKITIDSFVDSQIIVDDYMIADRIYLSRDIVRKATIEEREIQLSDLIIGSPTMETWGIELDLKKGEVIIRGGAFLL